MRTIFLSNLLRRGGVPAGTLSETGEGRGARALETTYLQNPGGAGAPPAGTTTRCEELADGAGLGRPWGVKLQGTLKQPTSEARPGVAQTPPRSAERRPRRLRRRCGRDDTAAPFGAPSPSHFAGGKKRPRDSGEGVGVPRAAKNRGDGARPLGCLTIASPSPFVPAKAGTQSELAKTRFPRPRERTA